MERDELLNISEWMDRCAKAIADMPYRAEFYEHDIAIQIAKHLPSIHRRGDPKWKPTLKPPQERATELRKRRIESGICSRCGGEIEQTGKRMCNRHLELDRMRYRKDEVSA